MLMFDPILVITRPKKNGLGSHWGVQFPYGRVVDYTQEAGLRITTEDGFSEGLDVTIVREVPWNMTLTVRARLDELLRNPRKYDPLAWNCETFAEWLTAGVPKSAQAFGAVLFLGFLAILAIAAK
jgi:hypothetical protein